MLRLDPTLILKSRRSTKPTGQYGTDADLRAARRKPTRQRFRWPIGGHALAAMLLVACSSLFADQRATYLFDVYFDDRLVGTHRFERTATDDGRDVIESHADFQLKILFFNAFQYQHHSREVWQNDCLVALTAETESRRGAEKTELSQEGSLPRLTVNGAEKEIAAPLDCLSTFAYWRRDLTSRSHLMNAQSGDVVPVQIQTLPVAEGATDERIRISSDKLNIDVIYDLKGDWIGLETALPKDHRLTYRLQPAYALAK